MITDEQVDEIIDVCELDRLHHVKRQMVRDVLAQISSVAMAEDPVRDAADSVLIHLSVGGHVSAGSPAINRLREALAKPAPRSLTEGERKAVLFCVDWTRSQAVHHAVFDPRVWGAPPTTDAASKSAREKLS